MPDTPAPGLLDSVQSIAATAMRGAHTRLQLAAVEFESERDRLIARLGLLLLALLLATFGLVLGMLWLLMWVDESHRLATLGGAALAFLLAAAASAAAVRAMARAGFMSTTLRVLGDDAQALAGVRPAARSHPMAAGALDG
jgi:uncharacterized membrane protein YqjE